MSTALLKPCEVAATLRISRSLAYRLIRQGEIRSVRIGRTVRVQVQDLENFIQANSVEPDFSVTTLPDRFQQERGA